MIYPARLVDFLQGISYLKLSSFCLKAFILLLPFQLRALYYNGSYLLSGNFNEYASFFVYFGDVLILVACVFFGMALYKKEVEKISVGEPVITMLVLFFVLMMMLSFFVAEEKVPVLLQSFRYLEFVLLYFLIINGVIRRKDVLVFFIYAMLIQSFIAIEQFLLQSSAGLRVLGEPMISSSIPGVAKLDVGDEKIVRAYGTFLHPNILGGFLVIALIWIYHSFKKNMWLYLIAVSVVLAALVFSFSRSAFIAFAGAFLIYFSISNIRIPFKQILLWLSVLLLIVVSFNLEEPAIDRILMSADSTAGEERVQYLRISKNMLMENPLGVGMGHFTLVMQDYVPTKLEPWSMQPVHNVYMMIATEAGLITAGVFLLLIIYVFYVLLKVVIGVKGEDRNFALVQISVFTVLAIIFLFDHYFYSFYQGQAFLFIYLALCSSLASRALLPSKNS